MVFDGKTSIVMSPPENFTVTLTFVLLTSTSNQFISLPYCTDDRNGEILTSGLYDK